MLYNNELTNLTPTHPYIQPQQTLISFSVLAAFWFGSVCGLGSCFHRLHLFFVPPHRGGESSAARKQYKTMESVRHSTANGFTVDPSPPLFFMCKSIHRVLLSCMTLIHWNGPGKKENWEDFTHLQSWQKTIQQGCIESACLSKDEANVCVLLKCLSWWPWSGFGWFSPVMIIFSATSFTLTKRLFLSPWLVYQKRFCRLHKSEF